jgi:uncharacterized MAPEG superfamily protein
VLSTQPHRVASEPCFLAMSAIRRFAAGILLIASLCASSACTETACITFILVNDIYLMADQAFYRSFTWSKSLIHNE